MDVNSDALRPTARFDVVPVTVGDATIMVEARVPESTGEEDVVSLTKAFDTVTASIHEVSSRLADTLRAVAPDKATLEMGFDLALENGALVAMLVKGSGSASLRVTLEWDKS